MHMTARHPPITGPTLQIHVTDEAGEPRITQWHLRCPPFRAAPCSRPGLLRGYPSRATRGPPSRAPPCSPVMGSPVPPRSGLHGGPRLGLRGPRLTLSVRLTRSYVYA